VAGPSGRQRRSQRVLPSEATVAAVVGTGEEATSYQVQYGIASVSEPAAPEAPGSVAGASAPVTVEQVLDGLSPSTTYRYRFVASNGHGAAVGEERTFTTRAAAVIPAGESCPNAQSRVEQPDGLALPDCRAYEMVSPTDTNGQDATKAETPPGVSRGLRPSFAGDVCAG